MSKRPMPHNAVNAIYNLGNKKVEVTLTLLYWEEDGISYYYSPALDLTGYGSTELEAKSSFSTTLEEFVIYTEHKRSIYTELERLGWTTNKRKKRVNPPNDDQLLQDNEVYKELSNRADVLYKEQHFGLAMA